jgi:hypothetical protein
MSAAIFTAITYNDFEKLKLQDVIEIAKTRKKYDEAHVG